MKERIVTILKIIDSALIELNYDAKKKEEILNRLSELAFKKEKLNDISLYLSDVKSREIEFSTAFGNLIAIPHAKSDAVKDPFLAFGRLKNPIEWGENLVKFVFLIGVPKQLTSTTHLKILAAISRSIMDEDFKKKLYDSTTNEEVEAILLNTIEKDKEK